MTTIYPVFVVMTCFALASIVASVIVAGALVAAKRGDRIRKRAHEHYAAKRRKDKGNQ